MTWVIPEEDLEEIAKKAKRDSAGITNPRPGKVKDILGTVPAKLVTRIAGGLPLEAQCRLKTEHQTTLSK